MPVSERKGWIAAVIAAAVLGFAGGNGHTTQGAVAHISDQLGQEKKAADCEHHRANATVQLALQPTVIEKSDLPPDCKH